MGLVLVPIPQDYLHGSRSQWMPYVEAIAQRSGNSAGVMEEMLEKGEAQAFLVWNPEKNKPQAFLGVRYMLGGDKRIAELIWLMGEDRKAWMHLFEDLETYLRDQQGCAAVKAIARPGWTKPLKASGYRLTHQIMEKSL
jgi:hypothetical protein